MNAQITEDYVSFEVAKLLKEKGFDWECIGTYSTGDKELSISSECPYSNDLNDDMFIAAPTIQMAMKWVRNEGFHIYVPIDIDYDEDERGDKWYHKPGYYPEIYRVCDGKIMYDDGSLYATPEQACEVAIKYCLESLM